MNHLHTEIHQADSVWLTKDRQITQGTTEIFFYLMKKAVCQKFQIKNFFTHSKALGFEAQFIFLRSSLELSL